jgi:hypothetical protein
VEPTPPVPANGALRALAGSKRKREPSPNHAEQLASKPTQNNFDKLSLPGATLKLPQPLNDSSALTTVSSRSEAGVPASAHSDVPWGRGKALPGDGQDLLGGRGEGFVPRLELLVQRHKLSEFEKWVLATLIGLVISQEVRKAMDYRNFTVGGPAENNCCDDCLSCRYQYLHHYYYYYYYYY